MLAWITALIEVVGAAFSRLMATKLGPWLVQAAAFLGIQFVSSHIVSGVVSPTLAQYVGGLGGDAVRWVSFLNVDRALTIVLSAYATVAATRWHFTRKKALQA